MNKTEQLLKLAWRCRRGMLELDLMLMNFLKNHGHKLTQHELNSFAELLKVPDPLLFDWLIKDEEPNLEFIHVVKLIQTHNNFKTFARL